VREIGETLDEASNRMDVSLPGTVVTVVTGYSEIRKTGTCSVLLAVCTEHQYRVSCGTAVGAGNKTVGRVAQSDCVP